MLVQATARDRIELTKLRAAIWKGPLTEAQFAERNQRLYGHVFGKRITTYLYRDKGEILTSMDINAIQIQTPRGVEEGYLVASVLTPMEQRRRGYASKMLSEFFAEEPNKPGVLYSDIDPKFYQRYGFTLRSVSVFEKVAVDKTFRMAPLSLKEMTSFINRFRTQAIKNERRVAAAVNMDPEFLDWQLDRFRMFHEAANKPVPNSFCWKISHGKIDHALCAAGYPANHQLHILWTQPGCDACLEAAAALAFRSGYPKCSYWDYWSGKPSSKGENPMVRVKGSATTLFVDPQLCDWW